MPDGIVAAIEVGETQSRVLIARDRAGALRVLAQAEAPSEGVQRGLVTDVVAASRGVRNAVRAAERQLGYPVYNAILSVPGATVHAVNGQAAVEPSGLRRSITQRDTNRVLSRARPRLNETRDRLLHVLPMRYSVDGIVYEDRPLRVRGRELTVSTCALVAEKVQVQALTDAVEAAGVHVTDLVSNALASSLAVLTEAEQRVGVLLMEIGTHATTLALLQRGCFLHQATIPLGGYHLTNDLAMGLSLPFDAAERLKREQGTLYLQGGPSTFSVIGDQGTPVTVQRQEMIALLRDRSAEILALALRRIQSAGWEHLPIGGIVLTGASAHLNGMERLALDLLHVPARIGAPRGLEALPVSIQDPAWAAPTGALIWKALCISGERRALAAGVGTGNGPLSQRISTWATRLFDIDPNQVEADETGGSGNGNGKGAVSMAVARRGEE